MLISPNSIGTPDESLLHNCAVPSAFSEEGNGSFWSNPRSTPTGSISDMHSHRLDELSSHEFNSGAGTAFTLVCAPLEQLVPPSQTLWKVGQLCHRHCCVHSVALAVLPSPLHDQAVSHDACAHRRQAGSMPLTVPPFTPLSHHQHTLTAHTGADQCPAGAGADKTANTADTYTSRSSAPLINLHSGQHLGSALLDLLPS